MPTKKQIQCAVESIKDVISRDYVVLRGTENLPGGSQPPGWSIIDPPEKLFPMLDTADKIAVLGKYVDWEGFNDAQKRSVIQRVVDGDSPEFWMDGIQAEGPTVSTVKAGLEKALFGGKRPEVKQESKTKEKTNEKGGIER